MNFFKRSNDHSSDSASRSRKPRGSDAGATASSVEDAQRVVKTTITTELSKSVKRLLEEHVGHQGPILSSDSANAICSVLEAIFMHGFKGIHGGGAFFC